MSNLIEKQAAIKVASKECFELRGVFGRIEEGLNELPTVKAIPIEWILKYRRNNRGEITYYSIDAIDHMLSEWCERNNIDMWDMIDRWEKENEIN